jgi:DNA-binding MarR family transcriptional regulator
METELKILKSILKADLTKSEIKIIVYLLNKKEKTVKMNNSEIAQALGMAQPNFVRALRKLEKNQVIGHRNEGLFVRSVNSWKNTETL